MYPKDLDEYSEDELRFELERREKLQNKKLCDYCGRSPVSRSCKFPERHHVHASQLSLSKEEIAFMRLNPEE